MEARRVPAGSMDVSIRRRNALDFHSISCIFLNDSAAVYAICFTVSTSIIFARSICMWKATYSVQILGSYEYVSY